MASVKYLVRSCIVLFATLLAGAAQAHVITSTVNPRPDQVIVTYNSPYTYTHDLRSQGLPGPRIESASLSVYLYDLTDVLFASPEQITFTFDKLASSTVKNVSFFGQDYTFGLATSMLSDGMLSVSISAGCSARLFGVCVLPQDVMMARSVLTVEVADVPEPGTLLCTAIGLAALGHLGRRRARRGPAA